jgi:SAM-dependent methyltransferase
MVRLVKQIKPSFIIDAYRRFNVDVSGYFTDIPTVDVYECVQTGYRFYHPLRLAGGEDLYRQLETISWYYMDWKWEHQVALDHLAANSRVLEVGCARGGFLRQCHRQGHEVMGLELNAEALSHAISAGLNVAHMTIEDFAKAKRPSFDAVCSFQVLEHIPDCHCFIKHCLAALKPGGRLILSVPNNDAFMLKSDPVQTLNMPPHHMGLWTPNAMVSLGFLFEMQLEKLEFEPLQSYHRDYSTSLVMGLLRLKRESENRRGESLPEAVVCEVAEAVLEQVPGHTLLAVFRKNGEC